MTNVIRCDLCGAIADRVAYQVTVDRLRIDPLVHHRGARADEGWAPKVKHLCPTCAASKRPLDLVIEPESPS